MNDDNNGDVVWRLFYLSQCINDVTDNVITRTVQACSLLLVCVAAIFSFFLIKNGPVRLEVPPLH